MWHTKHFGIVRCGLLPLYAGGLSRYAFAVSLVFLSSLSATAQPPVGGYMPRNVQRLEPFPEPPGGLVPYRKGSLWGYSDTTGRVVIAPTFVQEPRPFLLGYGAVDLDSHPLGQPSRHPDRFYEFNYPYQRFLFVNAHGETLRAGPKEGIVLGTDSSLRLVPRRESGFQPGVMRIGLTDTGRPVIITAPIQPPVAGDLYVKSLGEARGEAHKKIEERVRLLAPQYQRVALVDAGGRRLTRFGYSEIRPFREGRAVCRRAGSNSGNWGLLDLQGREVLPTIYSFVSNVYNDRVVVGKFENRTNFYALLDKAGQEILAFSPLGLKWLVPGQVLVEYPWPGSKDARLLDRDGHTVLGGQRFTRVAPLRNGSIEVECEPGRPGLLDAQLRWLVPCQVQRFYTQKVIAMHQGADSLYRAVVRQGRHGVLRTADGQLAVPCQYDSIQEVFFPYFFLAERAGRTYLLDKQGREILPALHLEYPLGALEARKPLYSIVAVRPDSQAAVLDTAGRLLTTWWPYRYDTKLGRIFCFPPHPTAQGLSIVEDCATRHTGVANQQGQLVLPIRLQTIFYQNDLYLIEYEQKIFVYDASMQMLASYPAGTRVTRLPHGWLATDKVLISPQGQQFIAPSRVYWATPELIGNYPPYPFEFGAWKTQHGYVTKAGVKLWEDK